MSLLYYSFDNEPDVDAKASMNPSTLNTQKDGIVSRSPLRVGRLAVNATFIILFLISADIQDLLLERRLVYRHCLLIKSQ
jgi:hypothetical protein